MSETTKSLRPIVTGGHTFTLSRLEYCFGLLKVVPLPSVTFGVCNRRYIQRYIQPSSGSSTIADGVTLQSGDKLVYHRDTQTEQELEPPPLTLTPPVTLALGYPYPGGGMNNPGRYGILSMVYMYGIQEV